jgi:Uma2 family endonuclease
MSVTVRQKASTAAQPEEEIRPRRWTREEYYRAADLGLFRPDERLELLDGEIYAKLSPRKPTHTTTVGHAADVLARAFGPGNYPRTEQPLVLNDLSEPEPDIVVVPGTRYDYQTEHPLAATALLVVEVADSSIRFDRGRKREAYARADIRDYWVLNLSKRQLEVHRDPAGSRYRSVTVYREGDTVTPLAAPQAAVRVSELLLPISPDENE